MISLARRKYLSNWVLGRSCTPCRCGDITHDSCDHWLRLAHWLLNSHGEWVNWEPIRVRVVSRLGQDPNWKEVLDVVDAEHYGSSVRRSAMDNFDSQFEGEWA